MSKNAPNKRTVFAVAFGATLLAILIAFVIGYIYIDIDFIYSASCNESSFSKFCFRDHDWDSETYLSVISSFYATIITILVALLGAVAAFAFISIRSSAYKKTKEEVEKEVERFFESKKSTDVVASAARTIDDKRQLIIENRLDKIEETLDSEGININSILGNDNEEEA